MILSGDGLESFVICSNVMLTSCGATFRGVGRLILSFYEQCFFVRYSVDEIMHFIAVSLLAPRYRRTSRGRVQLSPAGPTALLQGQAIHQTLAKKQVS